MEKNSTIGIHELKFTLECAEKLSKALISAIALRVCAVTDYGKRIIVFSSPIDTNDTELGMLVNIFAVDYGIELVSLNKYGETIAVNKSLPIDVLTKIAECLAKDLYTIIDW